MNRPRRSQMLLTAFLLWTAALLGAVVLVAGPFGMERNWSLMDAFYLALLVGHGLLAAWIYRSERVPATGVELLLTVTTILFLFSYIYASNANMDYVQRFAEGKTYINFGPDSRVQRLNSLLRYLPLFVAQVGCLLRYRLSIDRGDWVRRFSVGLVLLSALLASLSFPSFASNRGWGPLAFVSYVPLFLVLVRSNLREGILYGTLFGVIHTMITSYWLGTYSLVTLQLVTVAYAVLYALFMTAVMVVIRRRAAGALVFLPLLWALFDYLRSSGFIGYPWGMIGTTQYLFAPFIQVADVTGVWGVTAAVLAVNAAVAGLILRGRRALWPATAVAVGVLGLCGYGLIRLRDLDNRIEDAPKTTVALIQQNADPRKDNYREVFSVLTRLTDQTLAEDPALVVWSETAFVVNIRRWSQEDPRRYSYARLVREFLAYQRSIDTWLVTGNDDYELVYNEAGDEDRLNYNAAVLFDAEGNRVRTYRKVHLVPFTEYFPFKEQLPGAYEALKKFDVYLWEPGEERVVFEHPDFAFATPICFEDSFPQDVRLFVREGADLIVNLSNDYWSLREAEAEQHFANALFRAIENRRPLLRATASGVTCHVSATGRVVDRLPNYVEGSLTTRPALAELPTTVYTRYGDWFPLFCALSILLSFIRRRLG